MYIVDVVSISSANIRILENRVVFVGGEPGNFPLTGVWIWLSKFPPTGPLVCLKTSLPGKGWFPVTAEILLNCSSYQTTLSKGSKQIVFNFDSCYASSASNGPIQYCTVHITYLLFIFVVSTSFVFYVHPLCRLTYFLFLSAIISKVYRFKIIVCVTVLVLDVLGQR